LEGRVKLDGVIVTSPALNDLVQLVWLKIRIWLGL